MKTFTPGEILTAEDLNSQFTELARVDTVTLPVFDGAWRHDGGSGEVRSANGAHHLSISLVRTGSSFHMDGNSIIDIMRVNNLVSGLCPSSSITAWSASSALAQSIFKMMAPIVALPAGLRDHHDPT